jgi:hypothetical protein
MLSTVFILLLTVMKRTLFMGIIVTLVVILEGISYVQSRPILEQMHAYRGMDCPKSNDEYEILDPQDPRINKSKQIFINSGMSKSYVDQHIHLKCGYVTKGYTNILWSFSLQGYQADVHDTYSGKFNINPASGFSNIQWVTPPFIGAQIMNLCAQGKPVGNIHITLVKFPDTQKFKLYLAGTIFSPAPNIPPLPGTLMLPFVSQKEVAVDLQTGLCR